MTETGPPMPSFLASDTWTGIDNPDAVLARIVKTDSRIKGDGIGIRARPLPIYPEGRLLRLTCAGWGRAALHFFEHADKLYRLDGSSAPIHDVNAAIGIQLTDENVLFYLKYFCFFVYGDEGPFYVVHDLTDPGLPKDYGAMQTKGAAPGAWAVAQLFREPQVFGKTEEGHWRISALIQYGDALFLADLVVQPTGMIQMANDEPLMADLPRRIDLPLWTPG